MTVKPPPWDEDQQKQVHTVVEAALQIIAMKTDWGRGEDGRSRLPCPEQPLLLLGAPLGMYHCPGCGEMQLAGLPHLEPDADYEQVMGCPWPPGYADTET